MGIRNDLALGARIAAIRAGGLALALRGDPVARLLHKPWRLDPYPVYAALRRERRVVRSRTGLSVVATHAQCEHVLRDRSFGVRLADGDRPFGSPDEGSLMEPVDFSLLALDPPDHARLRRLAAPAFAPRRLERYRATAEKVAARLLDSAVRYERIDLMEHFARPLPIAVISELLGVPALDTPRFTAWGQALASALEGVHSVRHARALAAADRDMRALFADLVERRRADPGEDVVSTLVSALDDGTLTLDELQSLAGLLLIAGFETTTNLVGNAVRAMQATPGQWDALVADPDRAPAAVEETLRYDPPVQLTVRIAHADTEIDGVPLRRNTGVMVLIGAAGRDPEAHPDPDRFDLHREQATAHLAFSGGAHYCLGAALARMEGDVGLRALAERAPTLRARGRVVPKTATILRGPARYPVRVSAPVIDASD